MTLNDFNLKKHFMLEFRELWIFSEYETLGGLISEFQEATVKDILFMDNGELIQELKKFIEERRGIKYEDYEGLV